jgi:hypothetical protein
MSYLNSNIPTITCYVRNEFMFNHEKGHGEFTLADVHSVASIQKRVPLFEAFLENGVNWTRRPINAFCWKQDAEVLPLSEHMYWDCFSSYIDVQIRERLSGLQADLISITGVKRKGSYMFTLDLKLLNINVVMYLKWKMETILFTQIIELYGWIMPGHLTELIRTQALKLI